MATLKETFYQMPAEKLREIMCLRQVDLDRFKGITAKYQLVQILATELSRPAAVVHGLSLCNAHQIRFLKACMAVQKGTTVLWEQVVEHLGGKRIEPILREVIAELADMGIAILSNTQVHLQSGLEGYLPVSLSDRYSLEKCLQEYSAQAVLMLAERYDLPVAKPTKANHIQALSKNLLSPNIHNIVRILLTPEAKTVLEYILLCGGSVPAEEVIEPPAGYRGYYYRHDWVTNWQKGNIETPVDLLLSLGLLYTTYRGYGYELYLIIPADLKRFLSGENEEAFWLNIPTALVPQSTPQKSISTPPNLVRDVTSLLGYIQSQECVRTGVGHIHKTALKQAVRYLQYPDENYVSFLYSLCRESDFLTISGDKQIYSVSEKGRSWLHWDTKTQIRVLFEAWRGGIFWGEMFVEPMKKESSHRPLDFVTQLRSRVLKLICEPQETAFFSIADLSALFQFRSPFIAVGEQRASSEMVTPAIMVRSLLEECLYWLGLIELAWDEAQPPAPGTPARKIVRSTSPQEVSQEIVPLAYRLTPLGLWLLKGEQYDVPTPPREEDFILQANGEVFVSPYLSPAKYFEVLNYAEYPLKGNQSSHPVLTKESLRRAMDRGESPKTVLAFLSASSRVAVPQNIEYLINEVGGKHGHIHLGAATLYIQVDSPIVLQEIEARKEFKGLVHRKLSDTIALIHGDSVDKVLKELRKAGYLPVSDEDTPVAQRSEQAFHPKTPPQPKEAPGTRKSTNYLQRMEKIIDWKRILAEEVAQSNTTTSQALPRSQPAVEMPEGGQSDQKVVRFVLAQSIQQKKPLEFSLDSGTLGTPTKMLGEPQAIIGDAVQVYDLEKKTHHVLLISSIYWVRVVR